MAGSKERRNWPAAQDFSSATSSCIERQQTPENTPCSRGSLVIDGAAFSKRLLRNLALHTKITNFCESESACARLVSYICMCIMEKQCPRVNTFALDKNLARTKTICTMNSIGIILRVYTFGVHWATVKLLGFLCMMFDVLLLACYCEKYFEE